MTQNNSYDELFGLKVVVGMGAGMVGGIYSEILFNPSYEVQDLIDGALIGGTLGCFAGAFLPLAIGKALKVIKNRTSRNSSSDLEDKTKGQK